MSYFEVIPFDCLNYMFMKLNREDALNLSKTCKFLYEEYHDNLTKLSLYNIPFVKYLSINNIKRATRIKKEIFTNNYGAYVRNIIKTIGLYKKLNKVKIFLTIHNKECYSILFDELHNITRASTSGKINKIVILNMYSPLGHGKYPLEGGNELIGKIQIPDSINTIQIVDNISIWYIYTNFIDLRNNYTEKIVKEEKYYTIIRLIHNSPNYHPTHYYITNCTLQEDIDVASVHNITAFALLSNAKINNDKIPINNVDITTIDLLTPNHLYNYNIGDLYDLGIYSTFTIYNNVEDESKCYIIFSNTFSYKFKSSCGLHYEANDIDISKYTNAQTIAILDDVMTDAIELLLCKKINTVFDTLICIDVQKASTFKSIIEYTLAQKNIKNIFILRRKKGVNKKVYAYPTVYEDLMILINNGITFLHVDMPERMFPVKLRKKQKIINLISDITNLNTKHPQNRELLSILNNDRYYFKYNRCIYKYNLKKMIKYIHRILH